MAQDKARMPMSSAGLTSYADEYRSKIQFKPGHVIVIAILVMLVVIALHMWASGLLGQ